MSRAPSHAPQLPAVDTDEFAREFSHEHNDTLMVRESARAPSPRRKARPLIARACSLWIRHTQVAYLAGVTKSISTLNDLSDKIILAFNAHRRI